MKAVFFMNMNNEKVGRDGDTVKLLRECDSGIKMGVEAIDEVLPKVNDEGLSEMLRKSKYEHERLSAEVSKELDIHNDEGKSPNPALKGMSWLKTNAMYFADPSDSTVADLITDGCNMGVKSLSRYLNQYKSADRKSKNIAERLVNLELDLTEDVRAFL